MPNQKKVVNRRTSLGPAHALPWPIAAMSKSLQWWAWPPATVDLTKRGEKMIELPFARDEYQQRLRKIRAEMAKRGLELLVVNDVANQHYITGYDGWSFYTPQVVLVPVEEVEPVWIGRAMDAAGRPSDSLDEARKRGWLPGRPRSACRSPPHGLDRELDRRQGMGTPYRHRARSLLFLAESACPACRRTSQCDNARCRSPGELDLARSNRRPRSPICARHRPWPRRRSRGPSR